MVFTDMTAKEELLTVLSMKEHKREEDIFQSFKNFYRENPPPSLQIGVHHHGWRTRHGWLLEWIYRQVLGGR